MTKSSESLGQKHRPDRIGPDGKPYALTYFNGTRPVPGDAVDRIALKALRGTPADSSGDNLGGSIGLAIALLIIGALVFSAFGSVLSDLIGKYGLIITTLGGAALWFAVLRAGVLPSGEAYDFGRTLISKIIVACAVIAITQPLLLALLADAVADEATRGGLVQVGSGLIGVVIGMATANA